MTFSRGNLQYQANTQLWRFAEHQYDTIGAGNANISSTYDGWIDLFGWATSGYHNETDIDNLYYMPYSTSTFAEYDDINGTGYGPSTYMTDQNIIGTSANYDWGIFNSILNGGNETGLWRTLSQAEWEYLIAERADASSKYGVGVVDGINGFILLPDNWVNPTSIPFTSGIGSNRSIEEYANINSYSIEQWKEMEAAGAIFLPAAGQNNLSGLEFINVGGYYWSTTITNGNGFAYYFSFYSDFVGSTGANYRYTRQSVRLVQDVE